MEAGKKRCCEQRLGCGITDQKLAISEMSAKCGGGVEVGGTHPGGRVGWGGTHRLTEMGSVSFMPATREFYTAG